jgi:hypothetical protein
VSWSPFSSGGTPRTIVDASSDEDWDEIDMGKDSLLYGKLSVFNTHLSGLVIALPIAVFKHLHL